MPVEPSDNQISKAIYTRDTVRMSARYIHGKTLDFGAGTAKYKADILKHATAYTSFDMHAGPHIDITGDVLAPPFENDSFDTVICTQVMEHVREPWVMVEQIARILKPGGHCILTTPFMMPYHADPHDYYRYTLEGGCHLFERTGLRIVEKIKYGGLPIVLAEMYKFTFCNPYVHPHPGFVRRNLFRVIHWFLCRMNGATPQKTGTFANIYIVAQKPDVHIPA